MSRTATVGIWFLVAVGVTHLAIAVDNNYIGTESEVDEGQPVSVVVDWSDVPQLEVNVVEFTANSDLYDNVDNGFLPILPAMIHEDDGSSKIFELRVKVVNTVDVDGEVDVKGEVEVTNGRSNPIPICDPNAFYCSP